MRNMEQIKRGQKVATPFGSGTFVEFGLWTVGDQQTKRAGYLIALDAPHKGVLGEYVECDSNELRPLNPTVFIPAHTGEILKPESRRP